MAHVVTWISIVILILAFIFFIISIIILEYGVKVSKNGNIIIPWYYWLFFVGAGVFFLVYVLLQAFAVPGMEKKREEVQGNVPKQSEPVSHHVRSVPATQTYHNDPFSRSSDLGMLGRRSYLE